MRTFYEYQTTPVKWYSQLMPTTTKHCCCCFSYAFYYYICCFSPSALYCVGGLLRFLYVEGGLLHTARPLLRGWPALHT